MGIVSGELLKKKWFGQLDKDFRDLLEMGATDKEIWISLQESYPEEHITMSAISSRRYKILSKRNKTTPKRKKAKKRAVWDEVCEKILIELYVQGFTNQAIGRALIEAKVREKRFCTSKSVGDKLSKMKREGIIPRDRPSPLSAGPRTSTNLTPPPLAVPLMRPPLPPVPSLKKKKAPERNDVSISFSSGKEISFTHLPDSVASKVIDLCIGYFRTEDD